ncbi:signal transduction histidine kinase/ActR/RegA family two-component response regulator [Natronospira proteinivora]|uniref:histidine kinase n=1 Tax=Natronospira proteinivora TaxID=1807133 RepID=A0ABT1G963_9GAMM|nr:ATP-binding protein [Natronospira proteinivora]MCP1727845.1 signal transduction histidine kinase/ActR/RegA family two-component response regulator [Natronospira proteinivora]
MIRLILVAVLLLFLMPYSSPLNAEENETLDQALEELDALTHAVPWQEAQVLIDEFRHTYPSLSPQQQSYLDGMEARVRALAGQVDEGLVLLKRALERELDPATTVFLHSRSVQLNIMRGDYVNAFRELLAGQALLAEVEDAFIRSHFMGGATFLYRNLDQYGRALEFSEQAVEAARQSGDGQRICDALMERTGARERSYPPAMLEADAREALSVCQQAGSPVFAAVARQMIGKYLFQQGRLDEAIGTLRQALAEVEATGFADGILETRLVLARVLVASDMADEAELLLLDILPRLAVQRRWHNQQEVSELLSGLSESRGRYRQALGWQQAADAALDRRKEQELAIQAAYHQAQFERLNQEQTLALLEEEGRRDALLRDRALVGSGFLLLVAGLIYNRYRLKRRTQRAVERRNRELETLGQLIRRINQQHSLQEVLSPLLRWSLDTMVTVDYGEMLVRDWRHRRFRVLVNAGSVARPIVATPAPDHALLEQLEASEFLAEGLYYCEGFTQEGSPSGSDPWPSSLPLVALTIPGEDEIDGVMLFACEGGRGPRLSPADVERLSRIRRHVASALSRSQQAEDLNSERHRAEQAMGQLRATATALERGAEQAERANQEKAAFLSRISHELRTPLHAIIGYSQKLGRGLAREPSQDGLAAVDHIRSSGEHLLSLLEGLMELSTVEGGGRSGETESIVLKEFIEDTAAIVRPQLEDNGNRLHVSCDPQLDEMESDPVKLRQILFNLLSNAGKFTRGGHVELLVQPGNRRADAVETIQFQVRDTGIGISESEQERIFDAFHRGDDQHQGHYAGTGLGLSVTRGLCQALGGEISVSSQPGQGSHFVVTLPRSPELAAAECDSNQGLAASAAGPRLLVVEDNRINRELMLEYLGMEGFDLLAAEDGQVGLDMARAHCPDLILMDLNLPRLSGIEAVRMIRADRSIRHIPIIAVSADASRATREAAMNAGCDAYEVKPVDFPALVSRIRSALDESG